MAVSVFDPTFSSWWLGGGGALSLPAEPRRQMHFGNNGLKTGLWVAHDLDPTATLLFVGSTF